MNYKRIYDELISRGVNRGWTKKSAPVYVESHHIIPRSKGGSNHKDNLVILTAKEHFIAHHLLWKIHRDRSTFFALWAMMHDTRNNRIYFRDIPKSRENAAKFIVRRGEDHPLYGVGHSKESRLKMSKSHMGKSLTIETRMKMSDSRKGNTLQSKGVYYTPNGVGRSLRELALLNKCSTTTIQERCKRRPDDIIVSKKFPPEMIGKTFRELGWYYVPD